MASAPGFRFALQTNLGIQLALAAAIMAANPARAGDRDPPKIRHEIAQVLQQEFRYSPVSPNAPTAAVPLERPPNTDAIAMPKLTVFSSRIRMRDLETEIVKHQAQAKAQKPKWGCGPIYQKDFGKIRFGVFSIFYIPVAIGFSW
jgi:hypothetical protein